MVILGKMRNFAGIMYMREQYENDINSRSLRDRIGRVAGYCGRQVGGNQQEAGDGHHI